MRYEDIPKLATWKNDTSVLRRSASGSTLNKIDADIDNYWKSYSSMVKRNLLTDVNSNIRNWENINGTTVSFHPVVVALKEVITRKLRELSPSAYRYRQVMCLGFRVGCNTVTDEYFRYSPNDGVDMRKKCDEMMHAIRCAQGFVAASGMDSDETLKIFMAPEFYFRGANGAYSHDLVASILPTMTGLGMGGNAYEHWLFVYGTAIAASEEEFTCCRVCGPNPNTVEFIRDPTSRLSATGIHKKTQAVCKTNPAHPIEMRTYGAEVQNVALIQKGTDMHMVVKEYISGIDYKGNQVNVIEGKGKNRIVKTLNAIAPQGSNMSRIASKFQDERMGGGVFTMDGITFGMEICLDHIQSTGAAGRLGPYASTIQVLLIPSYGMDITHHSCVSGGVIFNVDGRGAGTSNVVVKGHTGVPITGTSIAAPNTGGQIERWGPFPIPRRG